MTPQGEVAGAVPVVRRTERCRGPLLPSLLWSVGARHEGSSLSHTEMRQSEQLAGAPVGCGLGCSRECEDTVQE